MSPRSQCVSRSLALHQCQVLTTGLLLVMYLWADSQPSSDTEILTHLLFVYFKVQQISECVSGTMLNRVTR